MFTNTSVLRRIIHLAVLVLLVGLFLFGNNTSFLAAEALVTGKAVNVRSGPGLGYAKKALVFKGTAVQALATKGDWTEIKLADGKKGWVKSEYIVVKKTALSPNPKQMAKDKHVEITGKVVCLRQGPGTNYPVCEKVKKGEKLPFLEQSNGWFKVKTANGIAYVAGWLARMIEVPVAQAATIGTLPVENSENQSSANWKEQAPAFLENAPSEFTPDTQNPSTPEKQDQASSESTSPVQAGQETGMTVSESEKGEITIVLDAGHGGYDPGAIGPTGLMEKQVNLSLALKTQSILEQKGYKVFLTRFDDRYLSLAERVNYVQQVNPDLFLSLHCNGATRRDKRGVSVYFDSSAISEEPLLLVRREKLARIIQTNLVSSTGLPDLGIQRSGFYVLRQTSVPAVLVETAFITNPEEEVLLGDPSFQDMVCHGLTRGIVEYLSQAYPQNSPSVHQESVSPDYMSLDRPASDGIQ